MPPRTLPWLSNSDKIPKPKKESESPPPKSYLKRESPVDKKEDSDNEDKNKIRAKKEPSSRGRSDFLKSCRLLKRVENWHWLLYIQIFQKDEISDLDDWLIPFANKWFFFGLRTAQSPPASPLIKRPPSEEYVSVLTPIYDSRYHLLTSKQMG